MSNTVILRLLEPMIISILSNMFRSEILHENHPLISFLEQRLSRIWALSGGLRCPELEGKLVELRRSSPDKLKELVEQLVKEYYGKIQPTRTIKKRREVVEAVV